VLYGFERSIVSSYVEVGLVPTSRPVFADLPTHDSRMTRTGLTAFPGSATGSSRTCPGRTQEGETHHPNPSTRPRASWSAAKVFQARRGVPSRVLIEIPRWSYNRGGGGSTKPPMIIHRRLTTVPPAGSLQIPVIRARQQHLTSPRFPEHPDASYGCSSGLCARLLAPSKSGPVRDESRG